MNRWSRSEKIALYSLLIAALGLIAAWLNVPEFRRVTGLPDVNNSLAARPEIQPSPKIESTSSGPGNDSRELSNQAAAGIAQNESGEPVTPAGWKTVARGTVPVDRPWTNAGHFRGQLLVMVWGRAVLGEHNFTVDPEGSAGATGPEFPLPNDSPFCALLKANERISKVGRSRVFNFSSETQVFLGPNDEPGYLGEGFKDNHGQWYYKICTRP
jgi:hypothetical protein